LVNLAYVLIMRFANVDELVRKKLSSTLSQQLKASISIGSLDLNETNVTISNIRIHDYKGTYDVGVRKVYVNYNLLRFIYSGFKLTHTIGQIAIYDPVVVYNYTPKPPKKKATKPIDLNHYFRRLAVYGGKVTIHASANPDAKGQIMWRASESFHNVQVNITNRRRSNIVVHAVSSNNAPFDAKVSLGRGILRRIDVTFDHYTPQQLDLLPVSDLQLNFGCTFSYQNPVQSNRRNKQIPTMKISTNMHYASASIEKHHVELQDMLITGDRKQLQVHSTQGKIDHSLVTWEGIVNNPLMDTRNFSVGLNLRKITISDIYQPIQGDFTGNVKASGTLKDPRVVFNGHSSQLTYQKQNFSNVDVNGTYAQKNLEFKMTNIDWQGTKVQGSGTLTSDNKLSVDLSLDQLSGALGDLIKVKGQVHTEYDLKKTDTPLQLVLSDVAISMKNYTLQQINGKGMIKNQVASFDLFAEDRQIQINGNLNMDNFHYDGSVRLNDLPIHQFLPEKQFEDQLPILNANIDLKGDRNECAGTASLHVKDDSHQLYDITLNSNADIKLVSKEFTLRDTDIRGQYRKVPVAVQFNAAGDMDSLRVTDLVVNDEIFAQGWLKKASGLKYGFSIEGAGLDLTHYLSYFPQGGKKLQYQGKVSFKTSYNLSNDDSVSGVIESDNITVNEDMYPFSSLLMLKGNTNDIHIDSLAVWNPRSNILAGTGNLLENNELSLNLKMKNYQLANLTPADDYSGFVDAKVNVNLTLNQKNAESLKPQIKMDVLGKQCNFAGIDIDSLRLDGTQYNDYLQVDSVRVYSSRMANVKGSGSIGYNLLSGKQIPSDRLMNLSASADVINLIEKLSGRFISGHGQGDVKLAVGIQEDGLSVKSGSISIPNGSFTVKSQTESVSKVQINAQIKDNALDLKQCRFYIGKGYIKIRNEIRNDDKDFYIAMLNLGQFFIKSSDDGILVTVPDYSQPNTTVNAILKGKSSDEASVSGPWDDMHIDGEVDLSNGYGMYPPNTSNLLQMINTVRESSTSSKVSDPLPFTMDVKIAFKDNMRYVTYPTDLLMTSDSYLRLVYDGSQFIVPDAMFIANQGSVDMFGTTFTLDNLELNISQYAIKLKGSFYKKAYDGSLITLTVSQLDDPEKTFLQNLKFTLHSDNPDDQSNTQILAKLRYNRPLEDLSRSQQTSMLQDEAIQLIGVNISSSFIDPYLSPFESKMRKLLHVDFFNISPGFIENVVNEYVINNPSNPDIPGQNTLQTNQNNIIHIGSTILLNNLSINVGKYVFRSVFIDYTALLQETTDLSNHSKLAVYHNTSLRVSLPWYLKLAYTFQVRPYGEKNSHEIFIQRSFRF